MATSSGMGMGSVEKRRKKMKSASYGDAVVASLCRLQQNDELCDFTVSAQGKSIRVHKMLLAGMSDYFRAMLLGPMKESHESHVDLKALTAESLQLIVNFLYSGAMQLDLENLTEVLDASSHLQIHTALDLCADYMVSLITFANAHDLLAIADTYSLLRVMDYYTNKVLGNFEDFNRTEQFLGITAAKLATYLADDRLKIHSEGALYDAVWRWYSHDTTRSNLLDDVIRHIRFGLIADTVLMTMPQHWLTTNYQAAMKYINVGLKYHMDVKTGHPVLDTYAKVRSTEQDLVFIHQGSSYKPFEVTGYDHKQDKFFQLATDISGSRDCRVTTVDNFVYICRVVDSGGGSLMNSLLRFDPRHLSLHELTPSRRLRLDPALASVGKFLYVFGGTTETYNVMDAVECYNVETNTWLDLRSLPLATHSLAAVAHGDSIYLSGGLEAASRQPVTSLRRFSTSERTYEALVSMHCARRLHEMVALHNKLYVLGGIAEHTFHQQTQIPIEYYSIAENQWTVLTTTLPGRAVGHFVHFGDAILSIGREHCEATEEEIWRYDTEAHTWSAYARVPRRSGLAMVSATKLNVNFHDDKICRHVISDKR